MPEGKGSINIKYNAGMVNVDDTEAINDSIEQLVLQASATLKSRGISSAELTLTFKSKIDG